MLLLKYNNGDKVVSIMYVDPQEPLDGIKRNLREELLNSEGKNTITSNPECHSQLLIIPNVFYNTCSISSDQRKICNSAF